MAVTFDVPRSPSGLGRSLRDAAPLLLGVGLLMAGNGLTSTLLGIRAGIEGFSASVTGIVLAGYYVGFVAGSLVAPGAIRRVGHVRVFAGLASLAAAAVLVHAIRYDPGTWFLVRVVSGLCLSALYVVTETWLNGAATNATRGGLLSSYMVVVTAGLLVGQVLFTFADPAGFAAFAMASVLVSLAVLPVALATVSPPTVPPLTRLSLRGLVAVAPLGAVGAAFSGFAGAAVVGAGAVYAAQSGLGRASTAMLIGSALAGGLVLQVPLGRASDRLDRRLVMAGGGGVAATAALGAAVAGPGRLPALFALTLLAGGFAYPLYSLSSAHLNDYLDDGPLVAAGARMVLVNGVGAVLGPIVGAAAIEVGGPGGLFVTLAAVYLLVAGYALYRTTRRAAVAAEDRAPYIAYPAEVGLTAATLTGGAGDELYPPSSGRAPAPSRPLAYAEQGSGLPVVLIADPDEGTSWDGVLSALAADGVRAVAPELRRGPLTEQDHVEDLLAVMRWLELPVATFVGARRAARVAARLWAEHPDRVSALVLVGGEGLAAPFEANRPVLDLAAIHLDLDAESFADLVVEFLRRDLPASLR